MKFLVTILSIFLSISIHGQDAYFQLYGKCCNDSIIPIEIYSLRKDSEKFVSWDTSMVVLPDTGMYVLSYQSDSLIVHIDKFGLTKDTIMAYSIEEYLDIDGRTSNFYWYCCGKKCNGYQIDWYNNGNKRVEGYFKKGKAIGEIKYYNREGFLRTILYYNKRGKYKGRKDW